MKSEAFLFTPDSSSKTLSFDDYTLQPTSAVFFVIKDGTNVNLGVGVSSPSKNFGGAVSDNVSKNSDQISTDCMIAKDGSTIKICGRVTPTGFDTVGELSLSFTNYDNTYKVAGIVFGN